MLRNASYVALVKTFCCFGFLDFCLRHPPHPAPLAGSPPIADVRICLGSPLVSRDRTPTTGPRSPCGMGISFDLHTASCVKITWPVGNRDCHTGIDWLWSHLSTYPNPTVAGYLWAAESNSPPYKVCL